MKSKYTCNQCGNYCSGNKQKCRLCKAKDWLFIDDEGMVEMTLEFNPEEMATIIMGAKSKYNLDSISQDDIQRYVEETLDTLAQDIVAMRDNEN